MVRDCDTCRYGSLKKDFICGLCMSYANETGDYAYWLPDSHAYDYLEEMDKEEREKENLNYNKLRKGETEIMEKLDVKDMIEDALANVLDNVKDKASDIIREQVVPAMKTAAENFLGELKEENTTTSSIWVKVRNTVVGLAVCLLVSVAEKVLLTTADNIDDDTKDETVEGADKMCIEDKILKGIEYRTCDTCKNIDLDGSKFPCKDCTSFMCYWEINPKYKELIDKKEKHEEHYDEHYVSAHQPIETMQANMSHDEFIGFLKGNIIKYVCRLGKKDNIEKETAKIKRYAEWLEQAVKGQTIDPRK